MTQGYKIYDQSGLYFLTLQVFDWLDVFTRQCYRDILIESFRFCRSKKGLSLHGYVIMSNHVHIIASAKNNNLSEILRDFKKYTSKEIIKQIKSTSESRIAWLLKYMEGAAAKHQRNAHYQVWTHENHAIQLESNQFMDQKLEYIHMNPVKAGIVDNPEEYRYSSARDYAGIKGLLDIDFIE